jgi:GxxExxY protein
MNPQISQINADLKRDPRTHAIIGAAMEVHRHLGNGFLEAVYHEALAIELAARGIPFQREVELAVTYKGTQLRCKYKADFICYGAIIVELKALGAISGIEQGQVLNYLKATGLHLGILLNFGTPSLECKRLIFSGRSLRESAQSADQKEATTDPQISQMNADENRNSYNLRQSAQSPD